MKYLTATMLALGVMFAVASAQACPHMDALLEEQQKERAATDATKGKAES